MAEPLLPPEAATRVVEGLVERHGGQLRDEQFTVEARPVGDTVVVSLMLLRRDRTFEYAMEAAIPVSEAGGMSPADGLECCLDFLDWYLGEYFREKREILLPLDWQPHRFGDHEVQARGDLRNPALDEAADAWLRGERPEVPERGRKESS